MRNLGNKRRVDKALSNYKDKDTKSIYRVSKRGEVSSYSRASSSSTYSSQKRRQNAIITSYIVDNLATAILESIRIVAATIREPRIFTSTLLAKTVIYIELYKIINQIRDKTS